MRMRYAALFLMACHKDSHQKHNEPPPVTHDDTGGSSVALDSERFTPCWSVRPDTPATTTAMRTTDVRLVGSWAAQAGWGVAVTQMDFDACDEILIGEH